MLKVICPLSIYIQQTKQNTYRQSQSTHMTKCFGKVDKKKTQNENEACLKRRRKLQ